MSLRINTHVSLSLSLSRASCTQDLVISTAQLVTMKKQRVLNMFSFILFFFFFFIRSNIYVVTKKIRMTS